ncbi:MFS transporter [Streptomyces luteolus]
MLVDATGSGMYLPVSLLYFHHVTGLPMTQVGAFMTLAALVGLVCTPVTGILVDRFGARAVVVTGYVVRAVGFAAYPLVDDGGQLLLVATLVALGDRSFPAAIQSLIADIAQGTGRDRLIAVQRSLRNAGLGAGGLLAGAVLGIGSDLAYHSLVLGNGAALLLAAGLLGSLPGTRGRSDAGPGAERAQAKRPGGYRDVLRDRPFVLLTAVNIPIAFGYMVLAVVLPVYVTQVLQASASWPGVLFAVNTVLVAGAQVPVTRLLARHRRTRSAALGGAVLSLSFVFFALLGAAPDSGVLIVGVFVATVLFTLGELLHGATASALATEAAPERLRGRYLAFYQFSWSVPATAAPALFTALIAFSPTAMWLLLATCAGLAALALVRLERRLPDAAVRPRGPEPEPEPEPEPAQPTPLTTKEGTPQ